MSVQVLRAGGSLRLPMAYEDFLALGETKHHEYYDGLLVVNPPSRRHALVQSRLTRALQDARPVGYEVLPEWGWHAGLQTVFEPDIMVFRADAPGPDLLREPPLLVVEVCSPSTRSEDWGRKRDLYARGGAPWYWVVDPDADAITVLHNESGQFMELQRHDTLGMLEVSEPFPVALDLLSVFGN